MAWFVELPADTQLAVIGVVVTLTVLAVELAIKYVPWLSFLRNYAQEWGLALGALVLNWLQNALPSQYPEASVLAVQLVLAILAVVMGLRKVLAKKAPRLLEDGRG